jgi:signal transduction histidine kinase/CheY-like chemotaxis protein
MAEPELVSRDMPLERQNEKLRRIVAALMRRVERDTDESGNAFTLFQRAIALEAEVEARTRDLSRTLEELNRANRRLETATALAEEANRAKSRFLAAVSHDLLQPLNAARLFIGSLGDGEHDEERRRILARLRSAFESVEGILGALLDISRLDSEATEAHVAPVPLARVLEPVGDEFREMAAARGVGFRLVPCSAWVESDPFYLRQIVQNLVSNAVRHCGRGRVLVGARAAGPGRIRVEVHDTGPGIRADDIPRVFREFARLEGGTPPGADPPGAGLGLAIVERACKLLGHPLEIRSTPGVGTSFSVTMPLARAEADGGASRGPAESDETLIALVLSGDATLAEMLTRLLEGWGMGALSAASLEEAFERVEQLGLAPDAVIADEALADGGTGFEALEALGRRCGGRPVAVLLADRAGLSGHHAAGAPGLSLLGKPVRPHRLRAVLGRLDPGRGRPAAQ